MAAEQSEWASKTGPYETVNKIPAKSLVPGTVWVGGTEMLTVGVKVVYWMTQVSVTVEAAALTVVLEEMISLAVSPGFRGGATPAGSRSKRTSRGSTSSMLI